MQNSTLLVLILEIVLFDNILKRDSQMFGISSLGKGRMLAL